MTYDITKRIAGSLSVAMVLAGCLSPVIPTPTAVPVKVEPTWEPTRALLSTEAILLKIVDGSQGSVISPVHGQLLVLACEKEAYDNCPGTYECDLGYVDLPKARFIRLQSINEEVSYCESRYTELIWAPDGTQFVYKKGFTSSDFTVYTADGTQKHSLGSFYLSNAFWTPDGQYLVVITRRGTNNQPAIEYTVYDALSWNKVCAVGSGNAMIGIVVGGQCTVPLRDGRAVFLSGTNGVEMAVCDDQVNCPGNNNLQSIGTFFGQTFEPARYRAQIENYWLRVFDSETNMTRTYEIPGYRVASIAWSPK